jgi:L-alanine-DL-glutamate epimerase-like enolase superfamily enzyme
LIELRRADTAIDGDDLMALKYAAHRLHPLHIPYGRSIKWAGHIEDGVDVLLLVLQTTDGLRGVGETPIRLRWHAATLKSLMVVVEEVFLPALKEVDLEDEAAVDAFLSGYAEHPLAKSLIDAACWDLRARAAGVPLWQRLGAPDPDVDISWTVTRAPPQEMARQAEQAAATRGVRAFKVKTGQGFDVDRQAVSEIRRAVGAEASLYADSNGADDASLVPDMSMMLADHGVILFEDPCNLAPNDQFRSVQGTSRLPILVDNGCRSLAQARLFLGVGAKALSVKIMKTGITESRVISALAQARQAGVAVGISASSSVGALAALALSASLPPAARVAPCEETFFATMDDVLLDPLQIKDGKVRLPSTPGYEPLIDWRKVESWHVG